MAGGWVVPAPPAPPGRAPRPRPRETVRCAHPPPRPQPVAEQEATRQHQVMNARTVCSWRAPDRMPPPPPQSTPGCQPPRNKRVQLPAPAAGARKQGHAYTGSTGSTPPQARPGGGRVVPRRHVRGSGTNLQAARLDRRATGADDATRLRRAPAAPAVSKRRARAARVGRAVLPSRAAPPRPTARPRAAGWALSAGQARPDRSCRRGARHARRLRSPGRGAGARAHEGTRRACCMPGARAAC